MEQKHSEIRRGHSAEKSEHMEALLRTGLQSLSLPQYAAPAMARFAFLLLERNRVMNLTAITEEADVAALHFLDSAALLGAADFRDRTVIDVGSGAGFPGLPLRLAEPSICLTLLDAQRKRVDFLREAASLLDLPDVACVHARAEEYGQGAGGNAEQKSGQGAGGNVEQKSGQSEEGNSGQRGAQETGRERFDIAVSRAVASLPMLAELCLPLVRTGGLFLAMKSVNSDGELSEASRALSLLGGGVERIYDYTIPGTDVRHRAVVIRKERPTPEAYPRPFSKIKKRPL